MLFSRLTAGLLRLVRLLLTAVFLVSLVVAGLFALVVHVLWALLRGRKPAVFHLYTQFRDASRRFRGPGMGFPPRTETTSPASDIVDVDAHEVDGVSKLK